MLWVLVAALPVGALVGMVGIGGLLLPALIGQLSGDPHLAAGTSSLAFCFTALVALPGLVRGGRLERRNAVPLACAAAPGALAGSLGADLLPGAVLVALLAAVCLGSGLHHLLSDQPHGDRRTLTVPAMLAVSFAVGMLSALTGTGGPVLLLPALLALHVEIRVAIALGLFSQLPIVGLAVVGYAVHGQVDYAWGSAIGVVAAIGVVLGMLLGGRTHPDRLRSLAAVVMVLTGAGLVGSLLV